MQDSLNKPKQNMQICRYIRRFSHSHLVYLPRFFIYVCRSYEEVSVINFTRVQFWAVRVSCVIWGPSSTWAEPVAHGGGDCILTCHRTAPWDKPARYHSLRCYPRPYLWFRRFPRYRIKPWSGKIVLITIRTACGHIRAAAFCLALEFLCLFII